MEAKVKVYDTPVKGYVYDGGEKFEEIYDGEICLSEEIRKKIFQEMEDEVIDYVGVDDGENIEKEIEIEINGRAFTVLCTVRVECRQGWWDGGNYATFREPERHGYYLGIESLKDICAYDEDGCLYRVSNLDEVKKDYDCVRLG